MKKSFIRRSFYARHERALRTRYLKMKFNVSRFVYEPWLVCGKTLLSTDSREASQNTRYIRVTRIFTQCPFSTPILQRGGVPAISALERHLNTPSFVLCGARGVMIITRIQRGMNSSSLLVIPLPNLIVQLQRMYRVGRKRRPIWFDADFVN